MVKLLTVAEAAPQFNKSEAAFRNWIAKEDCPLKTAKIGGRRLIRQEDIDECIRSSFEAAS